MDDHIQDLASINQVENRSIRISNISATRSHAQLIFRTVIKKVMDICRTLGSRSLSVIAMLKNVHFSGETNTAVHDLEKDDTARMLRSRSSKGHVSYPVASCILHRRGPSGYGCESGIWLDRLTSRCDGVTLKALRYRINIFTHLKFCFAAFQTQDSKFDDGFLRQNTLPIGHRVKYCTMQRPTAVGLRGCPGDCMLTSKKNMSSSCRETNYITSSSAHYGNIAVEGSPKSGPYPQKIFTHFKLCIASAIHNLK